jgi:hypothetical protein
MAEKGKSGGCRRQARALAGGSKGGKMGNKIRKSKGGKIGGKARTERKIMASIENGKKGGRPKRAMPEAGQPAEKKKA